MMFTKATSILLKQLLDQEFPTHLRRNKLSKAKRNGAINRIVLFVQTQDDNGDFGSSAMLTNYSKRKLIIELLTGIYN